MGNRLWVVALCLCAVPTAHAISINELRIDQPAADVDEYFELAGSPGESLSSLTYLVIGEGIGGSGTIEAVISLENQFIPDDGYFLAAESTFGTVGLPFQDATVDFTTTLNFTENDNLTHVLVDGFFGSLHDDLDMDDNGQLDIAPWTSVVDAVCLVEDPTAMFSEHYYCGDLGGAEVGPDGSNAPAHIYRLPDADGPFQIGFFPSGGDPGFIDTPGRRNEDIEPADCDFDDDGDCDTVDIDALVAEIAAGSHGVDFDMDGDGLVDTDDLDSWLTEAGESDPDVLAAYLHGDANLDGIVDGQDFIAWLGGRFTSTAAWTAGDFDANGMVDGQDFIVWNGNKFTAAGEGQVGYGGTMVFGVPEPSTGLGMLTFFGVGILLRGTRRTR
ncbi:MAG: hypothetical protein AAGF97_08155 [Planctomycetota bacterium]